MYADWRLEVEEYITKGYSGQKIKDAMFTSLKGKAKRNYQACDQKGDLMPKKILEKMDMDLEPLYPSGTSMPSFVALSKENGNL